MLPQGELGELAYLFGTQPLQADITGKKTKICTYRKKLAL